MLFKPSAERKSRMVRLAIRTFILVITIVPGLLISPRLEARQQPGTSVEPTIEEIPSSTAASTQPATTLAEPPPSATAQSSDQSSPLQFKIGDATITPVGFMDLTNTFRSTNSGTSLQTNFGNFPYSNNIPTGRLTEDRFSAQNSRIGFRVDAKVRNANILGYMEGDFFGGVGGSGSNIAFNTQVTSNSIVYRLRLYWISVRQRKFEFLAGQSWSMMTPNRKQISALPG